MNFIYFPIWAEKKKKKKKVRIHSQFELLSFFDVGRSALFIMFFYPYQSTSLQHGSNCLSNLVLIGYIEELILLQRSGIYSTKKLKNVRIHVLNPSIFKPKLKRIYLSIMIYSLVLEIDRSRVHQLQILIPVLISSLAINGGIQINLVLLELIPSYQQFTQIIEGKLLSYWVLIGI